MTKIISLILLAREILQNFVDMIYSDNTCTDHMNTNISSHNSIKSKGESIKNNETMNKHYFFLIYVSTDVCLLMKNHK